VLDSSPDHSGCRPRMSTSVWSNVPSSTAKSGAISSRDKRRVSRLTLTSIFVCDTGGMVVICAGTTGYNATLDLRYHWMRQKRFQGSHFANDDDAHALNDLVLAGKVDPCLSQTYTFDEIPYVHQLMFENRHPHGNMAVLVNSTKAGQTDVPH